MKYHPDYPIKLKPAKKHEIVLNACKDSLPKQYPINKDSREPSGAQETTLELTYT